jgi:hypothetical protein
LAWSWLSPGDGHGFLQVNGPEGSRFAGHRGDTSGL